MTTARPQRTGSRSVREITLANLFHAHSLKQKEAAELLGITQPEVSNLATGRLSGFTFDRLYRCLFALDTDVEITLKKHAPSATKAAGIHVSCLEI